MNLGHRYFHTLRHLRPIQFYGRLSQWVTKPTPDHSSPPETRSSIRVWTKAPSPPSSLLGPTRFYFLNTAREITSQPDWDAPEMAKLWRYNLHYFDDLVALAAEERSAWHETLMNRWIMENPPGQGTGWEPYPLSIRIVNWIKRALNGTPLSTLQTASLAVQTRFLVKKLEWHLLGNHLLANAKALIFASFYFSGSEADFWRRKGLRILASQLPEQILLDGGHYERSPMYHSLMLTDLLDLINLYNIYDQQIPPLWQRNAARMGAWLSAMTHPDGGIAFFNDAAFNIAPSFAELLTYAQRLGLRFDAPYVDPLASGYCRLQTSDALLLMDMAPVGPDFLPGHAHADTLSFELSLGNQRLFVNSGTSVYGLGPERERERGTAAHNTVRVDALNSSDVWHGFRVGRRAYPFDINVTANNVSASHDGYLHLPGRPIHSRRWRLKERQLVVEDQINGKGCHLIEVFFHIHPSWHAVANESNSFCLSTNDTTVRIELDPSLSWRLETSTWHPGFGLSESNLCIVGIREGELPIHFDTKVSW